VKLTDLGCGFAGTTEIIYTGSIKKISFAFAIFMNETAINKTQDKSMIKIQKDSGFGAYFMMTGVSVTLSLVINEFK